MDSKIKLKSCASLILCIVLFAGCTFRSENTYLKYKKYLNYSLGKHTVEKKSSQQNNSDAVINIAFFDKWILSYTDDTGAARKITIDNNYSENDEFGFEKQLVRQAGMLVSEQSEELLIPYFTPDEEELVQCSINVMLDYRDLNEWKGEVKSYSELSDPETGLDMKSMTLEKYQQSFGTYRVEISASSLAEHLSEFDGVKPKIESFVRNVLSYFDEQATKDIKELHFSRWAGEYREFVALYDRETDTFTWTTAGDLWDDRYVVDGRLTEVRKHYIGGELRYNHISVWKEDYGEYWINSGYLYGTFENKGIEYEDIELDGGSFGGHSWSLGGDKYELDTKNDVLRKNGVDIPGYDGDYISSTVFAEITGSVVHYDEQTRTIYIE